LMKPERAYQRLQKLMAKRDAVIPPAGASRDSPEFAAFMRAERRVGDFLDWHDRELATLREPVEGMTVDRYRERLAQLDAELDWLEAPAAEAGYTGVAQDAYSATWIDRQAFAANYDPRAEPEAESEGP
jgi:hypothetical protein